MKRQIVSLAHSVHVFNDGDVTVMVCAVPPEYLPEDGPDVLY